VVSTGALELRSTLTPEGECGENTPMRVERQASFQASHAAPEGRTVEISGTSSSSEVRGPGMPSHTRTSSVDTRHTVRDSAGNVVEGAHLTGSFEVTMADSDGGPRRTTRGTASEELADGSSAVLVLEDVVRGAPHTCPWPVSGTVRRTPAGGNEQVLTFGPECGQATLDGQALTLPQRPR
jgi:hypothetical protein